MFPESKLTISRLAILSAFIFPSLLFAEGPSLKVDSNRLPFGNETPEGAAVIFAKAFIDADSKAFLEICLKAEPNRKYSDFLQTKVKEIDAEIDRRKSGNFSGPKSIGKLFAARHLSRSGPASYAYAMYNLRDVMFVDVGSFLHDGKKWLNRTLVVKDTNDKWYVVPAPELFNPSGLIYTGLSEEPPSTQDYSEVYELKNGETNITTERTPSATP